VGTVFVIILLLALCGFVAYIGDLLGRRFGKKRLTLFGLRPKHTAIILTVATGVLIAGLTFGVALLSVPGFLRVVTEGERLVGQNARLQGANRTLQAQNAQREQDNRLLEARNAALQVTKQGLVEERDRLTGQNTRLAGENRRLSAANQRLAGANQRLEGQNRTLSAANTRITRENQALQAADARLREANRRLEAVQRDLRRRGQALRIEVSGLQRTARDYREEQYIFRRGEEIERQPMPANPPRQVLEDAVNNLLFTSRSRAQARRAEPGGGHERLYLVRHAQHPAGLAAEQRALRDWVIREAQRQQGVPLILRVVANENCVLGRPVPARLEVHRNDVVFRRNEAIAEAAIVAPAASGPRIAALGQILEDLIFFLQSQVGPTATSPARGMLPTDEESVGKLRYEELLAAAEQILDLQGRVVVTARARQDTLRAGPLSIWLDIARPAAGG
jgi:hypothetical protein